jgi:uncharacterized membrane protein YsdA (DUF1294 family)/cold shock CspA family protein
VLSDVQANRCSHGGFYRWRAKRITQTGHGHAMRHKGRISGWKDDRGFGFITSSTGGNQTFVHISSFANRSRRPSENDLVTYTLAADSKGRARAVQVEFVGHPARRMHNRPLVPAFVIATTFFALVGTAIALEVFPAEVLVFYAAVSVVAFVMYWHDKSAARVSRRRTPESTLHTIGLLGGWPGSLIAMHVFRHKSAKPSFRAVFWGTVVVNCGALAWLTSASGARFIESLL